MPAFPVPGAIVAITACSMFAPASILIVMPAEKPFRFATLTLVAPTAVFPETVVGPAPKTIALLFSSTVFATLTLPTSQPARAYGTHGPGALRAAPVPPSDGGSALSML